jgi:ADP-ribose pyrophosphatase YjhB (NUDIX family)
MSIIQYQNHDRLLVAVDCIIFGFDGKEIKALMVKRGFAPEQGKWSLMGGFVNKKESVDDAATRILGQLTGLIAIYMEQLFCFGNVERDPGGRVISVAYFALIKIDDYDQEIMRDYQARWFSLNRIPAMVFDHKQMIRLAKDRLRQKASHYPLGFALLPDKFTLRQLQSLYEAIYEKKLDKRNFTRKMLSLNILSKLEEKEKESSRKGAFYFVFDKKKYADLDKRGLSFFAS